MAQTVIGSRLEGLALLEINGLVLLSYNSIYGSAFEVLTQDGRNRICHGDNREEVVKKAVEWLEARAVLTGRPVRNIEQTATKAWSDALVDEQKKAAELRHIYEHMNMQKVVEAERVLDLKKFPPDDSLV